LHTKIHITKQILTFSPQNAVAASSNNSKAGPRERMAVHAAKAWNSEEVAQKSWFPVSVGFGLWMSKQ
jgi:hypothetical protein